jgi:hypothetical protein
MKDSMPVLVTRDQLAEAIGQSPDSVDRHRKRGLITAYKVGPKAVRYNLDEALAALVVPLPNPKDAESVAQGSRRKAA